MRTDPTSTVIETATAFAVAPGKDTDVVNMRDYSEQAVWVVATNVAGIASFTVTCYASDDDGITIPYTPLQSDDTIAAGSWTANDYIGTKVTAGAKTYGPFVFPRKGGYHRINITGSANGGSYSVRSQRIA